MYAILVLTNSLTNVGPQSNGSAKLTRRFSKELSPHLPANGAQMRAVHEQTGNGDLSNAEFMRTPSAGVAGFVSKNLSVLYSLKC